MAFPLILVALFAGVVVVAAIAFVFLRANQVNLTESDHEKPEWMRQAPPPETVQALRADGESAQVFDRDPGEKLASPFAEQIEDILRARLAAHPELSDLQVDLGTAADGGLEIWVNEEKFSSIDDLPNPALRQVFQESIDSWNRH